MPLAGKRKYAGASLTSPLSGFATFMGDYLQTEMSCSCFYFPYSKSNVSFASSILAGSKTPEGNAFFNCYVVLGSRFIFVLGRCTAHAPTGRHFHEYTVTENYKQSRWTPVLVYRFVLCSFCVVHDFH